MAEAFAKMQGGVEAHSAGSRPSGRVNRKAIAAMAELGYDLGEHASKSLQEIPQTEYDAVVTMGCGDACPWLPALRSEDWEIPDPKAMEPAAFIGVRDVIGAKVRALLASLSRSGPEAR
jgi:protein-tyrosine-phosphatase